MPAPIRATPAIDQLGAPSHGGAPLIHATDLLRALYRGAETNMTESFALNRRAFMGGGAALAAAAGLQPTWARSVSHGLAAKASGTLSGEDIRLTVAPTELSVDGRVGHDQIEATERVHHQLPGVDLL